MVLHFSVARHEFIRYTADLANTYTFLPRKFYRETYRVVFLDSKPEVKLHKIKRNENNYFQDTIHQEALSYITFVPLESRFFIRLLQTVVPTRANKIN